MISLEYQILIAILLDQLLGDPRWLPHPVRVIGAACVWCERLARAVLPPLRPDSAPSSWFWGSPEPRLGLCLPEQS